MTELTPEAKALFKEAREAFEPSEQRKARVGATVLISVAALTAAASGTATAAAGSKAVANAGLTLLKWPFVIGVALTVVGGVAWMASAGSQPPASPIDSAVRLPKATPLPAPQASVSVLPVVPTTPAVVPSELDHPFTKELPLASGHSEHGAVSDTLAHEVSIVRDARQALQDGDAARALTLLGGFASRYPRSVLREEELAIRALSLCRLGRVNEAKNVVLRLEKLAPGSRRLSRVRSSCAGQVSDGHQTEP